MKKPLVVLITAVALLLLLPAKALAQTGSEFKLGFKALADQIPGIVGVPTEDEHYGPNGDSLQQTTRGLMVWRKADNWTAFTDGAVTWINGPYGLVSRLNTQVFEWEQVQAPPPPPQQPSRGLVLYEANWAADMNDWPAVAGWSWRNGVLANDGTSQGIVIAAPYHLGAVTDYAVQADIQVVSMDQYRSFGLLVLDRYVCGIDSWNYSNTRRAKVGTVSGAAIATLSARDFDPGTGWHTYRAEVSGTQVTLIIDGVVMGTITSNSLAPPGQVGLWNDGVQLNVRSFRIVVL